MPLEEQTNNKTKKTALRILIVLLILLAILVIIYLILNLFKAKPPVDDLDLVLNQDQPIVGEVPEPKEFNIADPGVVADVGATNGTAEKKSEVVSEDLTLVATSFVERFGSYSNQSEYKNLDELDIFMVAEMKKWIKSYKEDLKNQNPDLNVYYAIETKVISKEELITDRIKGESELIIKTQRQEFNNTIANPRVFYQDVLLKLVKIDDQWKVSGAFWQ